MRARKRHLRATHTGPAVEPGWPACGVGPRYTVTSDRASVTCERCVPAKREKPRQMTLRLGR